MLSLSFAEEYQVIHDYAMTEASDQSNIYSRFKLQLYGHT